MTVPFDLSTFVVAASVVAGAYVIFGISAFGAALFTVPVLTHFLPLDFVLPMCALIDMTAAFTLGVRFTRDADWSELKWMVPLSFAGAVAGGGLTVIANAPNPAGFAILKDHFKDQAINPFGLFLAAMPPTLVGILCFRGYKGAVSEIVDWDLWAQWFASLDRSFLFLLILPFVVAAVGLWAEFSRREDTRPDSE